MPSIEIELEGYAEGVRTAGRYLITRRVAQGGEGVVFRAVDECTSKDVALKITRGITQRDRSYFMRTLQALSRINHPNVARPFDGGPLADGRAYLASVWIEGVSLNQCSSESTPTLPEVLRVGRAIALALAATHQAGVSHRDVKPANVLVPREGIALGWERAVLVDFGVHLDLHRQTAQGKGLPFIGSVKGTPLYMAPEQFLGRAQSEATDLYALGATLHALVYGHVPMAGSRIAKIPKGSGIPAIFVGEFVARRISEEVAIPTTPEAPAALCALLRGLLRRDPRERTKDAQSVASQLLAIELAL